MQASERILHSKDYLEGVEFTAARVNTNCSGITKPAISAALVKLVKDGQLSVSKRMFHGVSVNYYKKPVESVIGSLFMLWPAAPAPTQHTPRYC